MIDVLYTPDIDMQADMVIVGGGAILTNAGMIKTIENVLSRIRYQSLVIWGVGKAPNLGDDVIGRARLWGVRDWNSTNPDDNAHWVPCVSCLHPDLLDLRKSTPTQDFLAVNHWKRRPVNLPVEFTSITNKPNTIDAVMRAIAAHRYIITSSYHAAYWGILMNRRVMIVSAPWQEKLETFKWAVPQSTEFTWSLLDQTKNYPDSLAEAREINQAFANQVKLIASP